MNLTEMLLLAVPAILMAFKMGVLCVAAVWAVRAAFEPRALLPVAQRHAQRAAGGRRRSRV